MKDPVELKPGDPCPACGGELKAAPVPSDEQFAKAMDKENPVALPRNYDTASREVRDREGELYRCTDCNYKTRVASKGKARAKKGDE